MIDDTAFIWRQARQGLLPASIFVMFIVIMVVVLWIAKACHAAAADVAEGLAIMVTGSVVSGGCGCCIFLRAQRSPACALVYKLYMRYNNTVHACINI